MKRVLTARQLSRSKLIMGLFLFTLCVTFICNYVAAEMKPIESKYLWQGETYEKYIRIEMARGYIDEYTSERWCHS